MKKLNTSDGKIKHKIGMTVIAFNASEWLKTGDLPEGNGKYYQRAFIVDIRRDSYGELIADLIFENGISSNGHFTRGLKIIR